MNKTLFIGLLSLISIAATAQEKYMEHDADGRLRVLGYIDKKTEKKVGHWVEYGRNGRKISEVDYKNGEKDGCYYEYDDEGRVAVMQTYRDGLLDGPYLQYHDSPNKKGVLPLYVRAFYRDGQQEGMEYIYESNGKILHRRRYEAGTMLTDTAYEYNGIYITTMRRVTDPTDPEGFRYKEVTDFTPYKKAKVEIREERQSHRRKQVKSKHPQLQVAPKPKETPKTKLKVGKDGAIVLD